MTTQAKVQHTPGPWTFDETAEPFKDAISGLPYLSVYAPGFEIVRVHGNGKLNSRYDARLIAAAPELLEALVMIHRVMIQRNMAEDEREVANKAWTAIAKARGEETRS